MEQGAALRVLGQACEAVGDRGAADAAFRQSLEVLEAIQSRPELGQTLLAYGRFRTRDDEPGGRALIERALALFEEMDATGWIAEARAALSASRLGEHEGAARIVDEQAADRAVVQPLPPQPRHHVDQ